MSASACRTLVIALLFAVAVSQSKADESSAKRSFQLHYGATIEGLDDAKQVRVWLPLPSDSDAQRARLVGWQLPQAKARITQDKTYGNRILYFEFAPTRATETFKLEHDVTRFEVRALDSSISHKMDLPVKQRQLFLKSNARVPIQGKPLSLLPDFESEDNIQRAREIYNRVDSHVKYDKSKPGFGFGDVLWVCDSRTGNCTDFHSLFISMARSQSIPARFEIGFPLPSERSGTIAGYHCWAAFYDERKGWVPVDISEADKHPEMKDYYFGSLTKDRVAFSFGRDIVLEPPQAAPPLNYFVYPHIEVDGKPLPKNKIKLDFSFKDAT